MIDISPEVITILLFGGILVGVMFGYPLAIAVGAVALIIGFLVLGPKVFNLLQSRLFHLITSYVLMAVPLFVYMGNILQRSGLGEKMYDALYVWLGGFRGGLALVTVMMGTILAATVGIVGASVTMLTLVALPSMVNRGYSKSFASGAVCSGGTLGILIPPSIMLIVYGEMAQISVGKLFFAAFIPGFILSALYLAYITIRSFIQPSVAPSLPPEQREKVSFIRKTTLLLSSVAPTALLILAVLGTIFMGIAPPTEAAAIGGLAATLLMVAYGRFSWRTLKEAALETFMLTGRMHLIGGLSLAFVGVFIACGCSTVVQELVLNAPVDRWGIFAIIMFIFFFLGFFIDWIGILFIMVPIVTPIIIALEFNPLWFALMICVNLQMAFITPPMAGSIFYLRGAVDPKLNVTTWDVIRGVTPFVFLVMIGLVIMIIFPQVVIWLPGLMVK